MSILDALSSRKAAFLGYLTASTFLAGYAVFDALSERPNLYSAGIKVSQGAHIIALANWFVCMSLVLGKTFQRLMFGELRIIEVEHIYEQSWFTITNLLMTMALFRYDSNLLIFVLVTGLLFLKVFHWILTDRLEFLFQQQQQLTGNDYRIRDIVLSKPTFTLIVFLIIDYKIVMGCIDHSFVYSADVFVVFGLDFLMVYLDLLESTLKFVLNIAEMIYLICQRDDEEEVWENKVWLSKIGLIFISLFRFLALGFVFIGLIYAYTIPVNFTRDGYLAVVKLIEQLKDLIYLIRARRELERNLKDATEEDLERDDLCIICRDDMSLDQPTNHHRNFPKKLNCGHVLHYGCLKSWLEMSHVCPTCRREVFKPRSGSATPPANNEEGRAAPNGQPEQDNVNQQQPEGNDVNLQQNQDQQHHNEQQVPHEGTPTNERATATDEPIIGGSTPTPTVTTNTTRTTGTAGTNFTTTHTTASHGTNRFTIRLPNTAVIPPDWSILPLRRIPRNTESPPTGTTNNTDPTSSTSASSVRNSTGSSSGSAAANLLYRPLESGNKKHYELLLNNNAVFKLSVVENNNRRRVSTRSDSSNGSGNGSRGIAEEGVEEIL
ncbi:unnamed protein product [Ambrosiozyma monospora]|uniref:RING-type E3 ubiquitin transferase n=1 Tax=Ambrosiozyma monospora TaxID=43982 RepID=A0A9W6YY44_AMBMO|nr:unnamed protein product [Ambrosiozyma monospora]